MTLLYLAMMACLFALMALLPWEWAGFRWSELAAGVVASGFLAYMVRTRVLCITQAGVFVEGSGSRVTVRWTDFERVRERSHGRVELWFTDGEVEFANGGPNRRMDRRLRRRDAQRRVFISRYFRDWRTSPVGVALGDR